MPDYTITHTTKYEYSNSTSLSYNKAYVLPRSFDLPTFSQNVISSRLDIFPAARDLMEHNDFFGNPTNYFSLRNAHDTMTITAKSEVRIQPKQAYRMGQNHNDPSCELVRDWLHTQRDPEMLAAQQFVFPSPIVQTVSGLEAYAAESFTPHRPIISATTELMQRIYSDFDYVPGTTTIATPLIASVI